jgi:hypothetical protein
MPSGLKRYHESGQSPFVKFSCDHRRAMFSDPASRQVFELALERVRRSFVLCVYGYMGIAGARSSPDGRTRFFPTQAKVRLGWGTVLVLTHSSKSTA